MSAHVKCINNENKIHSIADTSRIFSSVLERVGQNMDGKIALGCAIAREAIHLKSDVATKRSLPLPAIGAISPEFGKKLAIYGIDTASVGTEMALSSIINLVIAMVHHLFYDESLDDEKLYEVRTRKVILYSNSIASASNLIATVLTKNYDKLDVGGLLVTICELITDVRFICKVKEEFIENKQSENFDGIKAEIDNLYAERFA
jgi:hypothetical protein